MRWSAGSDHARKSRTFGWGLTSASAVHLAGLLFGLEGLRFLRLAKSSALLVRPERTV